MKKSELFDEFRKVKTDLGTVVKGQHVELGVRLAATKAVVQTQLKQMVQTIEEAFPDMENFDVTTYSMF